MTVNFTSFPTLLTLLFIGLKLTNYIDWSWLWVLSPLWLPIVFVASVALIGLIVAIIIEFKSSTGKKV